MSEPRMRYVCSPDARPEALSSMDPNVRDQLIEALEEGESVTGYFQFDMAEYSQKKSHFDEFVAYRRKFEQFQKLKSN